MYDLLRSNIDIIVSMLNFLYSTFSFNFLKFRIKQNTPSDFSQTNIGDTNYQGSAPDFLMNFFLTRLSSSSLIDFISFLLMGH